ncbi:UNVERIFIED_CONTAM: hypothetical protein RMT77_011321 [Armadillidium vulgare]
MNRLFGNLRYELAENLICNQKEHSMKFKILTFLFKHFCRKEDIINRFYENIINIKASENTNNKIANDLTKKFIKQIIFVASNSDFSFENRFLTFMKESVYFLALQVCDLLKKETIAKDDWMNVSLLMKNLSITKQGTVNLMKTVHQILTTEKLDLSHSCELACYYFIADEIVNNHCEMVINQQSSYFEGHAKYEAVKDCLNYWRWFILYCGKDYIKLLLENTHEMHQTAITIIRNDKTIDIIVKIFENSVRNNNEIAVHYLWTNFISKIKNADFVLRKLLVDFATSPLHININMFLLFQIDIETILASQEFNYLLILENIFRNFRFHSLFVKTLNGLKRHFHLNSFLYLLNILIVRHSFDFSNEINIIKEYINSFPNYVKECVSVEPHFFYNNLLQETIMNAKKNLLNALLKIFEKQEVDLRVFLHTGSGRDLIVETIKIGNFEFIKNFIQEKYKRSDIINLKIFWFYGKGEILYEHFMETGKFETLCAVIDWLSEGVPEDLQGFKEGMLNRSKGLCLKNSIFRSNVDSSSDPFARVNEFLLWSLKTKESVSSFIRNINLCPNRRKEKGNMVSCYDELRTWILESKWSLLELFFNWKKSTIDEKWNFLLKLLNDVIFIAKIVLVARNSTLFLKFFIVFLNMNLSLSMLQMKVLKNNIFRAILNRNPDFSDFLCHWYENSGSADQLKSYIQSTGINFFDYDTLCYLTSQDIMSLITNLPPV